MPAPTPKGDFAQKVEETLGIIPGTKVFTPFPFSGVNLQDTAPAIDDKEFSYLENFFRLGNGYLRTAWDVGPSLYTVAGKTIIFFFWYNIAAIDYCAVFFDDGTAIQVAQATGVVTTISSMPGTFYLPGSSRPACSQSGTQYLLISNNKSKNDYWIWDGSQLYGAGTLAPIVTMNYTGNSYTNDPTVTAYGGTGTGASFSVTRQGDGVVAVQMLSPGSGYEINDVPQLQFSGGGSDTQAILTALLQSGGVTSVTITNAGSGYTTASVAFSGGGGIGAAGTVTVDPVSGTVIAVSVTNPGSGYTSAPNVAISGDGSNATGAAYISSGGVASVTVTNPGSGYRYPPPLSFQGGGGAGATAIANLTGTSIASINVANAGSGYFHTPTIIIDPPTSGTQATAVAVVVAGSIVSFRITNAGTGYTRLPEVTIIPDWRDTSGVTTVTVNDGGGSYSSNPTVTFSGGGATVQAVGYAVVVSSKVANIFISYSGYGYTSNPTVTITGGGGSGAKATAGISAGASASLVSPAAATVLLVPTTIASVTVESSGQGYTTAPAVIVGAGANNAASASISLMPYGVSGSSLETYLSRIWIFYPYQQSIIPTAGNWQVSAPESLTDFATSDGGSIFTNTDRFLRKQYTNGRQSNGYLYMFGDSSVNVVSNVSTSGSPPTTTLTYQNVDPQVGMAWRGSCQDFSRTILYANQTGIYGLYGGAATKVSKKLDQLFAAAIYPPDSRALIPSSACATIFNIKHYFFLFTITDPETGVVRNVMPAWNEAEWTITSQTPNLTYIGTQEVNSELTAWGTDGTSIYPLFAQPSVALQKRFSTKAYGTSALFILKQFSALYMQAQDQSSGLAGINCNVNFIASGIAVQNVANPSVENQQFNSGNYADAVFNQPNFQAAPPYWPVFGTGTGGWFFNSVLVQIATNSPDFILSNLVITYNDVTAYM